MRNKFPNKTAWTDRIVFAPGLANVEHFCSPRLRIWKNAPMFRHLFKKCFLPRTIARKPSRLGLVLERLEDRIVPTTALPPDVIITPSCDMV